MVLHSRGFITSPTIIPLPPENYDLFRDDETLKTHIQSEVEIYNGLRVLSEEFPKIKRRLFPYETYKSRL